MAARAGLNKNNSAVKRIMQEARELANDPSTDYTAAPLENDIFEWHCTIRGPSGTEFEGGVYHFRILLPAEYPFRPPSIMMLTPNGRFELNTKICISFTNYHEELWQPAWGVRTAIIGLQGFFPLKGTAAVGVGALEYPTAERKRLAALSREWVCPQCNQSNLEILPDPPSAGASSANACTPTDNQDSEPTNHAPMLATTAHSTGDVMTAPASTHEHSHEQPPSAPAPSPVTVVSSVQVVAPIPTRPRASPPVLSHRSPSPLAPQSKARTSNEGAGNASRPASAAQPSIAVALSVPPRPPVLLDTAICVLLVLMFALICRRIL
ncbi:UBC-like protein [Obba rivulosa]|uniref:UBC-like protein n=1 Tax=Obba rivulosa TaxID=1052685 RepID=A0A8E2DTN3_9APHY|nr:UBC-like protein [Obba rivulosa]